MSLADNQIATVRAYLAEHGLDPATASVTLRREGDAYVATGHEVAPPDAHECCCGVPGCDGGLAEMLAANGMDPAGVTSYTGTIPLGGEPS